MSLARYTRPVGKSIPDDSPRARARAREIETEIKREREGERNSEMPSFPFNIQRGKLRSLKINPIRP